MQSCEQTDVKRILERWYEMWTNTDLDIAEEIVHPEFVDHTSQSVPTHGLDAFKQFLRDERTGLPDISETPLQLISDGEWAAALYREQGTHLGEFVGLPPSGKHIDFVGFEIFRIQDGQIIEWWFSDQRMETYRQVGWALAVQDGVPTFRPASDHHAIE